MKTTAPKFTRSDYMEKRCTHRQYYGQFVTPEIKTLVSRWIGIPALMASKDERINDIPLYQWDGIAGSNKSALSIPGELSGYGFSDSDGKRIYSLACAVCVLKEAARKIVAEARK